MISSLHMARSELMEESLTRSVIGAFFEVYNTLGFGFLEHVYVRALEYELLNIAIEFHDPCVPQTFPRPDSISLISPIRLICRPLDIDGGKVAATRALPPAGHGLTIDG